MAVTKGKLVLRQTPRNCASQLTQGLLYEWKYGLWNAPAQKKKDNGTAKDLQVSKASCVSTCEDGLEKVLRTGKGAVRA